MAETIKRNLIPVFVTAALTVFGYLLILSAKAGALDTRVTSLEAREAIINSKMDRVLESVYRIEGKMERK